MFYGLIYDWANSGSVGAFSIAWCDLRSMGELVLFQGMGMEFSENIVLGGSEKEYCEYGPATGMLSWVYDVLDDFYANCFG